MLVLYEKAQAREIAEAGIAAGAEFDTGTAPPVTLHEVRLRP